MFKDSSYRGLMDILVLPLMLLIALLLSPALASAQTAGTASIQGTVTDPSGAALPSTKVVFTNKETGTTRTTVSDGAGLYSLPNIPVGPYTLSVTASGFEGFTQTGVLEVGSNVQVNPILKVGAETETIEVQSSGAALETESSSYKQVIDQKRITEMPLNGRQATQLILVSGGAVTAPPGDLVGSKTYATSVVIAVAGSQGNFNNYVLDGGSHTDTFTNINLPYPFPDALREFSVESNSLPARNGLHPGALVDGVTNSGTNQWHGTVFDFIRNNIINANNFFSTAKDTLKRNQFGGTLGGKILTDKMFFFAGYQGTRNDQVGNSNGYCVPTPYELNGDFSHMGGNCPVSATNITDPVTGANISATRQLPLSSISQQALNLAKYLPLSSADQYGRVNVALPANYTEDQYIGRVDYTFNQKHSIFGRYFITTYIMPSYYSPTNILLTTSAGNNERVQSFTLGDTYILSSKLVNTFHGTWARRRDDRGPTAGGINANNIGVNVYTYNPADFRLDVANNFSTGCSTCAPGYFNTNTESFSDDIDFVQGKHQIAFGAEIIRTGMDTNAGYLQNGSYNFGGLSSGPIVNGAQTTGEPMIDFIAGSMSNIGQAQAFSQSRAQQSAYRQTIFSTYVQDTYHFNSHLTANVGLRWEPMLFPIDKFSRGSSFNQAAFNANQHSTVFPNAPAGLFFYGDAGIPKSFTDDRLANFSPRVALTFDPFGTGKTVFRFGGAIMYDSPGLFSTQRLSSNPPYTDEIDVNGPVSFANPWGNYPGGSPFPGVFPPSSASTFATDSLYIIIPRHVQTPTVNQWTASVQQNFGRGWTFSLNYLGNKTSHLWVGNGVNPSVYIPGTWTGPGSCGSLTISPGMGNPCSSTGNANTRTVLSLANPTQGAYYSPVMTALSDGANTSYNGLITSIQHRMSNNFSFLANYTWSHCISPADDPGDIGQDVYENPNNPRLDRADCGFDVRHIFNATAVVASHFASLHGIASDLLNNWQIAPIVSLTSGLPLNVTSGADISLNGQGLDRPNLVNPTLVYSKKKITQSATGNRYYFNSAAFTPNAPGTFGNLGRNAFRTPNLPDVDAALSRNFPLFERLALNLRLEAFNVMNHPRFSVLNATGGNSYTTTLNSGTFGYVSGALDPRIFQAAAKFTF
jgi:hypothetical protein